MIAVERRFGELPSVKQIVQNFIENELRNAVAESQDMHFRLAWAQAIFCVLAPYLKDSNAIDTIVDPDKLLATEARRNQFAESVMDVIERCRGNGIAKSTCGRPATRNENESANACYEEFLSVPDMAASFFSHALRNDLLPDEFRADGPEAAAIFDELRQFTPLSNYDMNTDAGCAIDLSVMRLRENSKGDPFLLLERPDFAQYGPRT